VKVGDEITLVFPEEKSGLEAEKMDISVLYEDEDLLAINKAPGIVVHPTKGHPNGTIANGLVYYMQEKGETYKPRFINRLDMGTSGVLLIGKNSHAQNYFTKQSALGRIDKKYIAVVHGIVEEDSGTIDEPIGLASDTTPERIVRADGAPSVTHFAVEKRIDDGILPRTVLRIQIDTGRTHQIRVHMAYIGHPVISDNLYGNEPSAAVIADTGSDSLQKSVPADAAERPFIARQALHAHTLSFPHPKTAERITITAPLPDDIAALKELSSRA
jgi:23S rRNA pseudouridine1911/1915/1917 synthase